MRGRNEVLAVTFTNKAAEEMRGRVEALLGSDCSRMWVSTLFTPCLRAGLRAREAPAIGPSARLPRHLRLRSAQLTVVKQALKELHIDDSLVQPRAALSRISHAKNRMEGPDEPWRRPRAGTGATNNRGERSTPIT